MFIIFTFSLFRITIVFFLINILIFFKQNNRYINTTDNFKFINVIFYEIVHLKYIIGIEFVIYSRYNLIIIYKSSSASIIDKSNYLDRVLLTGVTRTTEEDIQYRFR